MRIAVIALLLWMSAGLAAQNQPSGSKGSGQNQNVPQNEAPPRSDDDEVSTPDTHFPASETSSSKDTGVDISPPKDDAAKHPYSKTAVEGDEAGGPGNAAGDVQEFHPWDPHRAIKDIEVGDFYLKRKNYRAAEDRYREALVYKPGDAIAQLRLGQALEKLGEFDEARQNYEGYLKILPEGPLAKEAHQGLDRLNKVESEKK
jgi:tetratricopeptide (TPR) repeat protein